MREPYWVRRPAVTVSVCLAVLAVLFSLLTAFVWVPEGLRHAQIFRVASVSMEPTLNPGELVLVQKDAYRIQPPQRGDIVAFVTPDGDAIWLKRVIAVGGDTISGTPDRTTLNAHQLYEPYVKRLPSGENYDASETFPEETFGPIRVPPNCFFVMGDNRDDSADSRMPNLGCVPLDRIRGKAISAGSRRIQIALSRGRKLQ